MDNITVVLAAVTASLVTFFLPLVRGKILKAGENRRSKRSPNNFTQWELDQMYLDVLVNKDN